MILSPEANTDFSGGLVSAFFFVSLDFELLEVDLFLCLVLVFLDLDLLRDRLEDFLRFLFFVCLDFPLFLDIDLDLDLCLDFSFILSFLLF